MTIQRSAITAACLALAALPAESQQLAEVLRPHARAWEQLVSAEDARARTPEQLAVLIQHTRSTEPELRRLAVRALGRLERPALADTIAILLRDASPRVRAEAAHALAQTVMRGAPAAARSALSSALASEREPIVIAAIVESLGRLQHTDAAEFRATVAQIAPHLQGNTALGATRGLFFVARQLRGRREVDPATRAALLRIARGSASSDTLLTRLRTLAAATWIATGRTDPASLGDLLRDAHPLVRREAVLGLEQAEDTAAAAHLLSSVLSDTSGAVRYEALRVYGRRFAASRGCEPLLQHVQDPFPHAALMAIDLLGSACRAPGRSINVLDSLVRTRSYTSDAAWQPSAHALVALAARAPDRARPRLSVFAGHPNLFARAWAAAAATTLEDLPTLLRLSRDVHPNVRTAAVSGLRRVAGRSADSVFIRQLGQSDYQLLMVSAVALDSTTHPGAAVALLDALDRISTTRRENSRDARAALLERAGQVGTAALVERVRPYLRDFDPLIADRAANVIRTWTGTPPEPAPAPLPIAAMPTFDEAVALARTPIVIQLLNGGEVEFQLLPFDAPANAARFAKLARAAFFDGLTIHRIAPNFVVQGGSPNANEYTGDAAFSRDEVGLENWRGTVGLSTRGRDTGDAQLYINLIDNVRLDHDYTVFAKVTRGMDWVDYMLEGEVIRRVR
jgi:cyclophilin family peptidyl-prolyl cis-trans isomerase/HEAT repeat protein